MITIVKPVKISIISHGYCVCVYVCVCKRNESSKKKSAHSAKIPNTVHYNMALLAAVPMWPLGVRILYLLKSPRLLPLATTTLFFVSMILTALDFHVNMQCLCFSEYLISPNTMVHLHDCIQQGFPFLMNDTPLYVCITLFV